MPWQQHVADVIGEIDPVTGRLAYDEFGLTVPRQSGKSTFVLAKFVHRGMATGFFGPRQQMIYTAQTRKKAREKWKEDYVAEIEASAAFRHKIKPAYGSGDEHLRFPNGSRFAIEANTEKAGHGGTLDEAYIDEAFAQVDGRLEQAFSPAMITRKNTQLGWISTAGWRGGSPYLEAKVKHGRAQAEMGVREGLAYFEWSAPEDADPEDRDVWRRCMPALGHTIDEQAIAGRLAGLTAEGKLNDFKRAYLNLWVPKAADTVPAAIDAGVWATLTSAAPPWGQNTAFVLDVAPDQSTATIAAAWKTDRGAWGQLADHRPGVGWVSARCDELTAKYGGEVLVEQGGTAAFLAPDIARVKTIPKRFYVEACSTVSALIASGTVHHGNQSELNEAVAASRWTTGEPRVFARKDPKVSPLVAWSMAVHALSGRPLEPFLIVT